MKLTYDQTLQLALEHDFTDFNLYRWPTLVAVRKLCKPADVKKALWGADYLDKWVAEGTSVPPDLWKETTYAQCLSFSVDLTTMLVCVRMRDGDNFSGDPSPFGYTRSWEVNIKDNKAFVTLVVAPALLRHLQATAYEAYVASEEAKAAAAVKAIYDNYFRSLT